MKKNLLSVLALGLLLGLAPVNSMASCSVNIKWDNSKGNTHKTVNSVSGKYETAGVYASMATSDTDVAPYSTITKSYSFTLGCLSKRRIKARIYGKGTSGGSIVNTWDEICTDIDVSPEGQTVTIDIRLNSSNTKDANGGQDCR